MQPRLHPCQQEGAMWDAARTAHLSCLVGHLVACLWLLAPLASRLPSHLGLLSLNGAVPLRRTPAVHACNACVASRGARPRRQHTSLLQMWPAMCGGCEFGVEVYNAKDAATPHGWPHLARAMHAAALHAMGA